MITSHVLNIVRYRLSQEPINTTFEAIRNELIAAQFHRDVFRRLLAEVPNLSQHVVLLQQLVETNVCMFYIKLNNVVDTDPQSPSFYRIFREMRSCPIAVTRRVSELRSRLNSNSEKMERVKDFRNWRAAHINLARSSELNLNIDEAVELLDELKSIFIQVGNIIDPSGVHDFLGLHRIEIEKLVFELRVYSAVMGVVDPLIQHSGTNRGDSEIAAIPTNYLEQIRDVMENEQRLLNENLMRISGTGEDSER